MRPTIPFIVLLAAFQCVPSAAQPPRPVASFVCGGIGQAEQDQMKADASRHDVALTFARDNGAYLADIDVQIRDANGTVVLATRCGGPIMLVDLPTRGTWHVTARSKGEPREKTLVAGAGHTAQATFVWPDGS